MRPHDYRNPNWKDQSRLGHVKSIGGDFHGHKERLIVCGIFLVLCFGVNDAIAQGFPRAEPVGFTWGELSLLPEYCKDTQGTVWDTLGNGGPMAPETPKWVSLMGEDFYHAHHYCYGLRNILRAQAVGESTAQGKDLLRNALGEFRYMFKNTSPMMPLKPEIYLKNGEVHLKLGNIVEAGVSFEQARRLKPDYWPAYSRWADVLLGLKQHDTARKLLEDGLQHSPGQQELVKRLTSLERAPRARTPASAQK